MKGQGACYGFTNVKVGYTGCAVLLCAHCSGEEGEGACQVSLHCISPGFRTLGPLSHQRRCRASSVHLVNVKKERKKEIPYKRVKLRTSLAPVGCNSPR